MIQESINKKIIRDFYRRAVAQGDIAFAEEIIADEYIQHSLMVKPGKAGLLEALSNMKQMPKPVTTSPPFLRLIVEGDYVVTNMCFMWDGQQKVVVDLFRFENGKVAEHWDAMQDVPDTSQNGHALMDGPVPDENAGLSASNKERVRRLYEQGFINQNIHACAEFIAPDLIQHIPEVRNGLAGLMEYLTNIPNGRTTDKVNHIIGEGDFVVVQAVGAYELKPTMFYDIVRLRDGKVVELWGIRQRIA